MKSKISGAFLILAFLCLGTCVSNTGTQQQQQQTSVSDPHPASPVPVYWNGDGGAALRLEPNNAQYKNNLRSANNAKSKAQSDRRTEEFYRRTEYLWH